MQNEDKNGAFDRLVAGLSTEDRTNLLERIHKTTEPSVELKENEPVDEKNITLLLRYKEESIFYKFIVWLRGLFQKKDTLKIYNEDILSSMAHKIDREHPGVINHRIKCLDTVFYQYIKSIKETADFFKPYFSFIDENPGDFYVFLSSFVTPELTNTINDQVDPFTLDNSIEPTNDVRNRLLKKLDDILNGIDGQQKTALYYAVSSVNWIKQFTKLPYLHFLAQFTNLTGSVYTCPYKNAINDFEIFSSLFSNVHSIQKEVFEAMFLFSIKKEKKKNFQEQDIERTVKEFLAQTNKHLATIKMFIVGVPIIKVGKVINEDYDWGPGNIPGVEAWFPSFRSQWRKIIEIRWNEWIRERKKNLLKEKLFSDFQISSFPSLKYKPWTELWMRVPFIYELTGGLLSWYVEEYYNDASQILSEVMMEGVFIRNDNRIEYSEGLNFFVQACNEMIKINAQLSPSGEYGMLFEEFSTNRIRTFQVQNQIDSMMSSVESEIHIIIDDFMKGARMMENVFKGIIDEYKDGLHDGLQNYTVIKGSQNRKWRDQLIEVRESLKKMMFYIVELEPIDLATSEE